MSTVLFFKALEPGERWISVHPHGPGSEAQPILIKPAGDGSYKVIGGAGGSLNHLRLTSVRDISSAGYKKELAQRQTSRREERKRQASKDRETGAAKSKAQAREVLRATVGDARAKAVQEIATEMGWDPESLRFPEERFQNVSKAARDKAAAKHGREIVAKAKEAAEFQRKRLVVDAEARDAAGLGEVPLTTSDPTSLSVQDLDPIRPATKGFGFSTDYKERAAARGASKEDIAQEAAAAKPPPDPAKAEKKAEQKDTGQRIAEELQTIRDPGPKVDPQKVVDAQKAVRILQAAKRLAAVESEARKKSRKLEGEQEPVDPKAYLMEEAGPVSMDTIQAGIENDVRTLRTRGFLNELGKTADGTSLGRYVGVGGFNSLNAVALAAGGASLIDRSVVDVLGIGGASEVLARRLRADLTDEEFQHTMEAVGAFHKDHYMKLSNESLKEARQWHEMAAEIELGEAANIRDLVTMQEMNRRRRDFTANAQRVLGTAAGEMEGNAALTAALGAPIRNEVVVSLGKTSVESAITQARAIGLDKGDYEVAGAGASTVLTVHASGMDKLAAPVSREDLVATRTALDIMNGGQDEENWLPLGVANRPDLAMNVKPGTAPTLAQPFEVSGGDVHGAIEAYIGGRAADGDSPEAIMQGLLSEDTMQKSGDRDAFIAAINEIAPLYGADGKMTRVEAYADKFNAMADSFVEKRYGADRTPIQSQKFSVDDKSVDALHRALSAHPDGVAAFKVVGELTPQDQGALRQRFMQEYGRSDPKAEGLRQAVVKLDAAEPAKESEGLFGVGTNPEWTQWKQDRDKAAEAANAAELTWPKYVVTMGSPQAAYASMQDVVKSEVLRSFADTHNKLNPKTPLKVGRQVIQNDINHLSALDPDARERRSDERKGLIDSLRTRVSGRYSSGSVSQKLEAAQAAEVAAGQAQMGLFGDEQPAAAGKTRTISRSDLDAEPGEYKDFAAWAGKVRSDISAAISSGATVTLHSEDGKRIPIASVKDGRMLDNKGQQWGMVGALSHKDSKIEITHPAETAPKATPEKPLQLGERHSLGHAAERQIAGMMPIVGANFKPGERPTKLWQPTMSGEYVGRQRAIKLIEADKHLMLGLGVGSGKTAIALSALAHLKEKGKVKRGIFLTPSIVQGEFHGQALNILQPGKFKWHANPGADRAERIAAYKDPTTDFSVVTHQAFRDDVLHMASQQDGIDAAAAAEKMDAMTPADRRTYVSGVLKKEGIDYQYLAVDEGHNLLNRAGKENSQMANVIDALSAETPYYVNASGDPTKNDVSETFDMLSKMDPDKYTDRAAFLRKYGVDTDAAREGLRMEMARHFYLGKIDPGVKANRQKISVSVTPKAGQRDTLAEVTAAGTKGRLARMKGEVDVEAMKTLSPNSFADVPEANHRAVASELQSNLGIVQNTATMQAINDGAKTEKLVELAAARKGKPGVVFIHSLQRVEEAAARLKAAGHRVVTLTGGDSTQEKDQKKADYQAGKYDIMVASDAGCVGANLQAGKWLVQFDTPTTAMVHSQRNGRIHRTGQTEDVELIDLVADHPAERHAQQRLEKKYALREIMTSPLDGLDDSGIAGYLAQARAGKREAQQPAFSPTPEDAEGAPSDEAEGQHSLF